MCSMVSFRLEFRQALCLIAAFSVLAWAGCKPTAAEPKSTPSGKHDQSVEKSVKSETPPTEAAKETVKKPSQETVAEPVKEAKKEPAKDAEKTPAKDDAKKSSGIETTGNPTLDPTVLWMPKPVENPDADASDEAGMKPYTESIPSTDAKFEMVPIRGGTFTMGSPASEKDRRDDEGPQVEVKVDPFWMGKFEVTWKEYELWGMSLDKERIAKEASPNAQDQKADALTVPTPPYSDMSFGMGKMNCPAVCMTQFAAKIYCKWLSAKTGRYYRLPTEAEWEYACRAGTKTAYSFGDDPAQLGEYAWFFDNSDDKYHKLGEKKPNPWGLYDMHGNVAEWCVDQYIPDRYKQLAALPQPVVNPVAPVTEGFSQLVRGGSWLDEAALLRSAARRGSTPDWKAQDPQIPQSIWFHTDANFVGFRVVRPLRVPTAEEAARYEVTEFEKQEYLEYMQVLKNK